MFWNLFLFFFFLIHEICFLKARLGNAKTCFRKAPNRTRSGTNPLLCNCNCNVNCDAISFFWLLMPYCPIFLLNDEPRSNRTIIQIRRGPVQWTIYNVSASSCSIWQVISQYEFNFHIEIFILLINFHK